MKLTSLCVTAGLLLAACDSKSDKTTETSKDSSSMHMNMEAKENKPDFSNVQFASSKDTTCGMPLSAGVEDTAIVDGKVYGFCSKECKDEFLKTLQAKK